MRASKTTRRCNGSSRPSRARTGSRVFALVSAPVDTTQHPPPFPHARSLASNNLNQKGGAALAKGLKGNSTLTSLK